ncbi:MAG TPA: CPBP family intramembrane glutamic endopeptidase [Candidatus Thermoplasmatota archaeon]|nr:CPBP family intramembrane glutamic endopeptidase [Candidatus Thermoplasmatota archaeon]
MEWTHAGEAPPTTPYPAYARVLAAVVALAVTLFTADVALALLARGLGLTAAAAVLGALPLLALFALYAIAPRALTAGVKRVAPGVDLADEGAFFAVALLATALYAIYGLSVLIESALFIEAPGASPLGGEVTLSSDALLMGLVLNGVLLLAPPLAWIVFVNRRRVDEVPAALDLTTRKLGVSLALGAGTAVAVIVAFALVVTALLAAGVVLPENEQAVAIARALSIPAALAVAVGSSVTEEVFYRGFLLKRVGILAQAALFAVAHVSYGNLVQLVVTFALGVVFALLVRRTGNLMAPIAAHFTFNAIMLLAERFATT